MFCILFILSGNATAIVYAVQFCEDKLDSWMSTVGIACLVYVNMQGLCLELWLLLYTDVVIFHIEWCTGKP